MNFLHTTIQVNPEISGLMIEIQWSVRVMVFFLLSPAKLSRLTWKLS
ncbi:MAG TPA: hypothetical protein VGK57_16745 [Candidatus Binatia bacterium]